MPKIADGNLTLADIPQVGAEWEVISAFALTYNGYEQCGSVEACAEIATARKHETLAELRTCLFFLERASHHQGEAPDDEKMVYARSLVEKIRLKIVEANYGDASSPLWDRIRHLEGRTLTTLHQRKPFMVTAILEDCVRVLPKDGRGVERTVRRDRIEQIATLNLPRDEIQQRIKREFPDTRNASYMAAIAFALSEQANQ